MRVFKGFYCLLFSNMCVAGLNFEELQKNVDKLSPVDIIEKIFYIEVDAFWDIFYSDKELDNWKDAPSDVKGRNLLKRKFIEFYGNEAWEEFRVILQNNLDNSEGGCYRWEDKYDDNYDPDYPQKLTEEFQKKYSTSSGSLNSSASLSSSESENI